VRLEDDHEYKVCENLEGKGHGLCEGTILAVGWRDGKITILFKSG